MVSLAIPAAASRHRQYDGRKGMSAQSGGRNRPSPGAKLALDALGTFLRRRHPYDTAQNVAAETGVAAETVRNWLGERNEMRAAHVIALADAYGSAALAAVWPGAAPGWLGDAVLREKVARLEAARTDAEAEIAALRARLAGEAGR